MSGETGALSGSAATILRFWYFLGRSWCLLRSLGKALSSSHAIHYFGSRSFPLCSCNTHSIVGRVSLGVGRFVDWLCPGSRLPLRNLDDIFA